MSQEARDRPGQCRYEELLREAGVNGRIHRIEHGQRQGAAPIRMKERVE